MGTDQPFNPDEHEWLPDGGRIDTGPVTMTREEFEQAVRDGIAYPAAHDQPGTGHRP